MRTICFYFQVHQPYRLKRYRFFNIGNDHHYFDDYSNRVIMRKVAEKCYLPTNQVMLDLIKEFGSKFKIAYSLSGTFIDQCEMYAPDVLESFQKLAKTGSVEFLAETYPHALVALKSKQEFMEQVQKQAAKIKDLFGQQPQVFRNTELIYDDGIGEMVAEMGYKAMLTEGAKHIMGWKSPNYVYYNVRNPKLKLLLKNFKLSDDIAFRFSNRAWESWPLTTEKFVSWLNAVPQEEETINLFMDYETFGEHQWADTGIFHFLRALPAAVFKYSNFIFATPSEVADMHQPKAALHVPHPISWADEERDLTAWLGNELQDEAFDKLYELKQKVDVINDPQMKKDWLYLQTSDHFYYMCTKFFSDGDVHKYFNPYDTPYEAFINYMNVLSDFSIRIDKFSHPVLQSISKDEKSVEELEKMIKEYQEELKKRKKQTKATTTKSKDLSTKSTKKNETKLPPKTGNETEKKSKAKTKKQTVK